MVVGRFFRGLTAYDLLGNLVPGVILLTAFLLFLPGGRLPSSVGASVLFALFAYLLGGVVQEYASAAVGDRNRFEQSIDTDGQLDELGILPSEESGDTESTSGQLLRQSFLHPLSFNNDERDQNPVDEQILASQIKQHIYNEHGVEPDSDSSSVLYRLMLSEIDASNNPPTAIRMQALRNLYRGVWISAWWSVLLLTASFVIRHALLGCDDFPFQFHRPGYYEFWPNVWQPLLLTVGSVVVFRYINEQRSSDFVEYLFTDYAAAVSLPDETNTELDQRDDPD